MTESSVQFDESKEAVKESKKPLKSRRGGRRAGAGRPKTEGLDRSMNKSITLRASEWEKLGEKAVAVQETLPQYAAAQLRKSLKPEPIPQPPQTSSQPTSSAAKSFNWGFCFLYMSVVFLFFTFGVLYSPVIKSKIYGIETVELQKFTDSNGFEQPYISLPDGIFYDYSSDDNKQIMLKYNF